MNKIIICNKNRDGAKIWLERINHTNEFTLHSDKDFVLEYSRIIFDILPEDSEEFDFKFGNTKAKCKSYDPSGGPFISVGQELGDFKIERIYRDYTLENPLLKFVVSYG